MHPCTFGFDKTTAHRTSMTPAQDYLSCPIRPYLFLSNHRPRRSGGGRISEKGVRPLLFSVRNWNTTSAARRLKPFGSRPNHIHHCLCRFRPQFPSRQTVLSPAQASPSPARLPSPTSPPASPTPHPLRAVGCLLACRDFVPLLTPFLPRPLSPDSLPHLSPAAPFTAWRSLLRAASSSPFGSS